MTLTATHVNEGAVISPTEVDELLKLMKPDKPLQVTSAKGTRRMSFEQVAKRLPVWTQKHQVVVSLIDGEIKLGDRDFMFGRTTAKSELLNAQTGLDQIRQQVRQYQDMEAKRLAAVEELRNKIANKNRGVPIDEILHEVMGWPNVIDVIFGPATDLISGTSLAAGEFIITFLPVAFEGIDKGYPPGAWAVSNPIRFRVREDGKVWGVGTKAANSTSYHPHLNASSVCNGNLLKPFGVMVREDNVLGAIGVLDEWRIAKGEGHYNDHDWFKSAWKWWRNPILAGNDAMRRLWMFDGRWDGKTIQIAKQNNPKPVTTTIEEFFGADLEDILHVADAKHFVTPTDVQRYAQERNQAAARGACVNCGREAKGCSCHGLACSGCVKVAGLCQCPPVAGHIAPVRKFTNGVDTYQLITELYNDGRDNVNYRCERTNANGTVCHTPAVWYRNYTYPPFMCEEHLPVKAKAALESMRKANKAAAEAKTPTHTQPTGLIPDPARGAIMRHRHEHQHTGGKKHQHFHEHYTTDAITEAINEHDDAHTAYLFSTGNQQRKQKHQEIR